jgi:hypothetical protein
MKTCVLLTSTVLLTLLAAPTLSAPAPADPPEAAELIKARLKAAEEAYASMAPSGEECDRGEEALYTWSKRILEADRELAVDGKAVVAALEGHRDRMTEIEKKIKKYEAERAAPKGSYQPYQRARIASAAFYRAEAELWLQRAKAKK